MRAAVALTAILCAAPAVAHADDTFESRATGAQVVRDLGDLAWALTATCDRGTDTEQRQCRHVRDARLQSVSGATLLVDAEPEAFHVGAWNPQKKSLELTVQACVRCGGVQVDNETMYIVGDVAPRIEGGRVHSGKDLLTTSKPFSDEAAAKAWVKSLRKLRVQMLLKVPAHPAWKAEGKQGVTLEVAGYRVSTPCDGAIVAANPPATQLPPDKERCRAATASPAELPPGAGPDALSQSAVATAMKPVVDAAEACFEKYGVAGTAKYMVQIAADGTVIDYQQTGDFAGETPTGKCIDKTMNKVRFPASKAGRMSIGYPIVLQ
jgi:hypothetical protein